MSTTQPKIVELQDVNTFDLKREGKALEMIHDGYHVLRQGTHTYFVRSQTNANKSYKVTVGDLPECECPDFEHRCKKVAGGECKHIKLVRWVSEHE